jgi:hypothetical protein
MIEKCIKYKSKNIIFPYYILIYKIKVEEKQIPFYYLVKSFEITIVRLELNKFVNIVAKYYDINNVLYLRKLIALNVVRC